MFGDLDWLLTRRAGLSASAELLVSRSYRRRQTSAMWKLIFCSNMYNMSSACRVSCDHWCNAGLRSSGRWNNHHHHSVCSATVSAAGTLYWQRSLRQRQPQVRSELEMGKARASEAGDMQGIWHPNYLCGDIDMYIPPPLEKPNT